MTNTKNIIKNILIISGKLLFVAFALVSMAFVNNEFKKKKVQNISIKIISENNPMLCSVEEIENYIDKNNLQLIDKSYSELNFYNIEKIINEKNEVKSSAVYFTPDHQLYIEVKERKPIARIFTNHINHYIDDEWKLFKVTKSYKVPLIMGELYENPSIFKHYPIRKVLLSENFSNSSLMDDVYLVTQSVLKDTTIQNFIDYLYFTSNKEIEIYPVIGKFKVLVGNSEHFQEKMNKLKLFIAQGLNKNDAWTKYSQINLKYKNLIYCTKK